MRHLVVMQKMPAKTRDKPITQINRWSHQRGHSAGYMSRTFSTKDRALNIITTIHLMRR